jgi:hypothetical protein
MWRRIFFLHSKIWGRIGILNKGLAKTMVCRTSLGFRCNLGHWMVGLWEGKKICFFISKYCTALSLIFLLFFYPPACSFRWFIMLKALFAGLLWEKTLLDGRRLCWEVQTNRAHISTWPQATGHMGTQLELALTKNFCLFIIMSLGNVQMLY